MIKKIICLLFVCLFSVKANCQTFVDYISSKSFEDLITMMKNPAKNEELVVQMAFSFPPEYHQYVMPMIATTYGISEKVRMMPGIVEWRRKLPTRIAPQLNEYAKKHLRYLNPAFYPYLMPEAWPPLPNEEENASESPFLPQVFQISSAQEMDKIFPSDINPNSFFAKLLTQQDADLPSDEQVDVLSEKDVEAVLNVMGKLNALAQGREGFERRNTLIVDYLDMDLLLEAYVNPCHSLITRLDKINADKWFSMQVAKENMTMEDFIKKCDATIKAYRLYLATPSVTLAILDLAKKAQKLPEDSYNRRLYMVLVRMFNSTKADVQSVKPKATELRKIFGEKFLFLGTPLLLDF
ncbi:MAG: hypothetical protein E7013_03785 [Alphaproteobacteria bacterium]|nr:hypothetical protein [Alphaproteobacteria bacterium]